MNPSRYPLLEGLAKLCGDECVEDLEELAEEAEELEKLATGLPEPRLGAQNGGPLASRVANLDEVTGAAIEATGNVGLARYLAIRRIYLKLGGQAPRATGAVCPVCGSKPRVVVLSRVSQGFFDGYIPIARCICGMEWSVEEWRCPSCGSHGRDSFNIYIIKPGVLEVRECRSCGYRMAVTSVRPKQAEVMLASILLGV